MMPDLRETKVNLGAALYDLKRYPEALAAPQRRRLAPESSRRRPSGSTTAGWSTRSSATSSTSYEDFRGGPSTLKPDFDNGRAADGRGLRWSRSTADIRARLALSFGPSPTLSLGLEAWWKASSL